MQRIGQFIFDLARDPLPVIGVGKPVRPVGDEGPGADLRDPARQRVDIAIGVIGLVDLGAEPCIGNPAPFHQKTVQRGHEFGMGGRRQPPVIRDLAGVPQPFHGGRPMGHVADIAVAGGVVEHAQILGNRRAGQHLVARRDRQRHLQRAERGEIQLRIAPLQHFDAVERVVLQRIDQLRLERRAAAGGAKGAVAGGAAGAAGDLREFGRRQPAELVAVVFAVARQRRRDRRRGSAPCRRHRWQRGNRRRRSGTSRPAHCVCAGTASPAPRQRRHAGGGSVPRWHKLHRRRTRRWRSCAAAA